MRSVRFEQPYEHTLRVPSEAADRRLIIQQAPFDAEGFASTGAVSAAQRSMHQQYCRGRANTIVCALCSTALSTSASIVGASSCACPRDATLSSSVLKDPTGSLQPQNPAVAVWDSSIVVAKYLEKQAILQQDVLAAAGAGCSGQVAAKVGSSAGGSDSHSRGGAKADDGDPPAAAVW